MAEPNDPKRPAPPGSAKSPLPRLWKHKTEDDETDVDGNPVSKKRKRKARGEAADSPTGKSEKSKKKAKGEEKPGEKGVLIEETPNFDTHEARQRVRILIGVGMTLLALGVGFVVYRMLFPGPANVEEPVDPSALMAASAAGSEARDRAEQEARLMVDHAREVAENGNTTLAVSILKRVTTSYAATRASAEAKEALAHPEQNLPLFLDRKTVLATPDGSPAPPPKPPEEAPKAVVNATPSNVPAAKGAQASLVLPANAPEAAPPPPSTAPAVAQAVGKPLPKDFKARDRSGVHATGWHLEIIGNRDGAPMVLVPGGTFIQGRDDADPIEGPAHKVNLGTYYVDRHEVTVRQFNLFQKESGKRTDRVRALARDAALKAIDAEEDRPVVMVSARDARDFATWAGKRLPTEAQWEAAGRTTDGRLYPWGVDAATVSPRTPKQIAAVMSTPHDVSPYGASDLAGNAWEWTKDWFDPKAYQAFRTAPADNPNGPDARPKSQQLVVKGSSPVWRLSERSAMKSDARLPYLGFRCVLPVEGPGNAFDPTPAPGQNAAPGSGGSSVPF